MTEPSVVAKTLQTLKTNSPEILTGLGIAGLVGTAYLSVKTGIEIGRDEDADPWASNKEKAKRHWKKFVPPVVSGTVTAVCIIAANKAGNRKTAAAVTAYSLLDRGFTEYKEKVLEQVGKNKEQRIRDQIAIDRIEQHPPLDGQIVMTGNGNALCCELMNMRYFYSDKEKLLKAENQVNHWINQSGMGTLSDFYSLIGIAPTPGSEDLGWDLDSGLLQLEFTYVGSENGTPCLAFDYNYTKAIT